MKKLFLITLLLTSCSSFQEMAETGNPPVGVVNTISGSAALVEQSLCPLKTIQNIESIAVRFIRVALPEWNPICEVEE